jgi:hypothetical protein
MQVCVSKCPDRDLFTKEQVRDFAKETGSKLCRYDIPVDDYVNQEFGQKGPCPSLPIFERFDSMQVFCLIIHTFITIFLALHFCIGVLQILWLLQQMRILH